MSGSIASPPRAASLADGLACHQAGRLDEAESAYAQVLAREPANAVALSLLGNVAYQRGRFIEAERLIGEAIRLDPSTAMHRVMLGHVHRRRQDPASAAACYRAALALSPDSTPAATSLAETLADAGQWRAAGEVLRQQATQGPSLVQVWQRLGQMAARARSFDEAAGCFEAALALAPGRTDLLYNLGVVACDRFQLDVAEAWFRRVLAVDAEHVDARINLSAVLLKLGRAAEAKAQRDAAYGRQCLFVREAVGAVRRVLVLFDAGRGNVNLSHLFSPERNTLIDWMIEYAPPGQRSRLPPYDLVFNAIGDADMAGAAVRASLPFVDACERPVLNHPSRVARTSRDRARQLLGGITGLAVPPVWRVAADEPWPSEIEQHLPVLVRPVDSHGGTGLRRIEDSAGLQRLAATRDEPLHVTAYRHFASADGFHRKYRVIFIDRQPFPYHLAISPRWLVHYATADMQAHGWKLEEERRFLDNPVHALGETGWATIGAIGRAMDLDYAGVDFSVLPDGGILLFEANPTMLVHPEEPGSVLDFKNPHVSRILDAFDEHLAALCETSRCKNNFKDEL